MRSSGISKVKAFSVVPRRKTAETMVVLIVFASTASLLAFPEQTRASSIPQPVPIGVDLSPYDYNSYTINAVVLRQVYHISWARVEVGFNQQFRNEYQGLTRAGINMLGRLDIGTLNTTGLSDAQPCHLKCNWTIADWGRVVNWAVRNYSNIHFWEIWNEPQYSESDSGPLTNANATGYFQVLRTAQSIIKAHNSTDFVVCLGGGSSFTAYAKDFQGSFSFASKVWSYGAAQYCDVISLHVYTGFRYLLSDKVPWLGTTAGDSISAGLDQYEALTGKPVWVTETGLPGNNWTDSSGATVISSPERQALFLNQSFGLALSKPYVKAIFWWEMIGLDDPPRDFALFSAAKGQLVPRPAFHELENLLNAFLVGTTVTATWPTTVISTQTTTSIPEITAPTEAQPQSSELLAVIGSIVVIAMITIALTYQARRRR